MNRFDDTISVIMACYNCEATLHRAIDSIVNQTYSNWKLICCDDGSTDNTMHVLTEYKSKYTEKIIVIQNAENKKLPYSLNHCLQYADTKFVARMDADDVSKPERFQKQIDFLKKHPEIDLVGTAMTVFDGEKVVGSMVKPEQVDKYSIIKSPCFCHATIMTYKYVYDKLGGYSLNKKNLRVEDAELWFRFFANGFKGANLSEELYVVTDDDSALKRRKFGLRFNAMRTLFDGYKLLNYPLKYYPLVFLPVIKGLVPRSIYKRLRNKGFKNENKSDVSYS